MNASGQIKGLLAVVAVLLLTGRACGQVVCWDFPLTNSCHEGLAFSDGVTGVLVWGAGDTIRLTVGRGDLWDHRGGYDWTEAQSYTNIVAAALSGDAMRLKELFRKDTLSGQPRNPYMLPLGRILVTVPGKVLRRGTLDPMTGLGELQFDDGACVSLAMGRESRQFSIQFEEHCRYRVRAMNCMEFPLARKALEDKGFSAAEMLCGRNENAGGFVWRLPADNPVSLLWHRRKDALSITTGRANERCFDPVEFDRIRNESLSQWTEFWREGASVEVPDPVIQRIFDYGMYRFGAMTDPSGVPAGLQGQWLEDDRLVPWHGDYHFNINVQECYSPAYRGGHFSHLKPLFDMVLGWRPLLRKNAERFCGIKNGYVMPHSVDDRGVCIGGFWTGTIDHGSAAWTADMMYRYACYSGDVDFLRNGGLDFMKGAMNVYRAMMKDEGGILSMPLGPSPEWGADDVRVAVGRNPSFQLAAAHRLARDLMGAAALLGEAADPMWLDVERRLPQYVAGEGGINLFEGRPFTESHRHHSHMAGLYPFDTIDVSDPRNAEVIGETYRRWIMNGTGRWTGWCVPWASILNVHLGYPVAGVQLLKNWDAYFCNSGHGSLHNAYAPGFTAFTVSDNFVNSGTGQIMQMDGQCAAAAAVMELMVHEVNGKARFFQGCPSEWKCVSFRNIALSDGRRASGSRENGNVNVVYQ